MRTFIGFVVDDKTKEILYEFVERNFTKIPKEWIYAQDNLHLTTNFIGEIDENAYLIIVKLLENMSNEFRKTQVNIVGLGTFRKKKKNILYFKISKNVDLSEMQIKLRNMINANSDNMEFIPHITIGRNSISDLIDLNEIENINFEQSFEVNKLAIFESKRINNKLCYLPLKEWNLK
jgi:2'-5' RNA ligase